MRLAIIAVSLVLALGIAGAAVFTLNNNTDDSSQVVDTDSDGVANVNDTYIFDPDCSEDTDNDGICDAEEGSFNSGSDEALQASLSTEKDEYSTNEDFEVELQIDNLAKTSAENLDYTVQEIIHIRNMRAESEARRRLPAGESTSAVFATGFKGEARENMQYNGRVQAQATTDYTTTATSSIELVSFDQRAEVTREQLTAANNGGPVVMQINTRSPKIVRVEDNSTTFEIAGGLRNLGEGEITGFNDSSDVDFNLEFPNVPDSEKTECQKEIDLSFGSNAFICSFELSEDALGTRLTMDAELNYRYLSRDELSVRFN
jgi:hypothetical protein